jgi:hypothetical protein
MTATSSTAAEALAAARQNMKDLEAAARAEAAENRRREREERNAKLNADTAEFREREYEHSIGDNGDFIGLNGLDLDFVEYMTPQFSRSMSHKEALALHTALGESLGLTK